MLDSIPVAAEMPVAFSKEGYVPTTKVLRVVAGESNTQNAVLFPAEATTTIQSNVGGTLTTPDGTVHTRSLMLANLSQQGSVRLQQTGLGPRREMGCGIFIPHKGIDAVMNSQ